MYIIIYLYTYYTYVYLRYVYKLLTVHDSARVYDQFGLLNKY